MEPLGAKIRRQRRRLGLSLDELAGKAGISKPYLSLIETGRSPNPPSDEKLRRLEQTLRFGSGELMTQAHLQRTPRDVRAVLQRLLVNSTKDAGTAAPGEVDPEAVSKVLLQLAGERTITATMGAMQAVPVIDCVSAGYPRDFTDPAYPRRTADEYVGAPDVRDPAAFAARISGDSMLPAYAEGDIVIFSPALSPREGDDCFVRLSDGQTTFKRVFFEVDDRNKPLLRLQPRNERYRAMTMPKSSVSGLYRAVYRYQRVGD